MSFNFKIEVIDSLEPGLVVKLTGELDQLTVASLKDKLVEIAAEKCSQLIFDLGELEFMASAGLSIFAYYHDLYRSNGSGQLMKIINCPDAVMRVFKLTKMDEILTIS